MGATLLGAIKRHDRSTSSCHDNSSNDPTHLRRPYDSSDSELKESQTSYRDIRFLLLPTLDLLASDPQKKCRNHVEGYEKREERHERILNRSGQGSEWYGNRTGLKEAY